VKVWVVDLTQSVSVIVPAYNAAATIRPTLEALLKQEFDAPLEIIIIDDCSTDQTRDICESLGLKVARNDVNMGLAASLNRGILLSENGIVVTLHSDVIPLSRDWLKRLVAPLSADDTGASSSLQHPPDVQVSSVTLWESLLWGKVKPHHALNNKADAYKKDVFRRVGTFDHARFRTAGEDEDMALRLRLHGVKVVSSSGEVQHNHKFGPNPERKMLAKILTKEYSYGRSGGTLRRKFPAYRPGAYVYPTPKSPLYDGLTRVGLCIGVFIPFLQWICIPGLLASSLDGIGATAQRIDRRTKLAAYPVLNLMRYWTYTVGYLIGLVSGRQR
jgi:glycosyltransferase involved in cell wall biosynthesis